MKTANPPETPARKNSAAARRRRWAGLLCGLLVATAVTAEDGPRVVVDRTTDAVLAVLQNKSLSSADKRTKIEDIVYTEVDFEVLSRLVLARNWSQLTAAQKDDFMLEFKRHLSVTYGDNVDNYKNERSEIVGDRQEARGDWTVLTKIIRGGPDDVVVDYRLRQTNGRWRIIDVIVEGVSLVANFRSQFQEIISNGGIDRLLQLLREKNAKGEPMKTG
jgi:phospholipid transport system substrate-binding protein